MCSPTGVLLTLLEAEDVVYSLRKTRDIDAIPSAAGLQITSARAWPSYRVNAHVCAHNTLIKPQLLVFLQLNDPVLTSLSGQT